MNEYDAYQFDVSVQQFKRWLEKRLKLAKRDAVDTLARRILADRRIPASGSKSLLAAHLRSKAYTAAEQDAFEIAWDEMRADSEQGRE